MLNDKAGMLYQLWELIDAGIDKFEELIAKCIEIVCITIAIIIVVATYIYLFLMLFYNPIGAIVLFVLATALFTSIYENL